MLAEPSHDKEKAENTFFIPEGNLTKLNPVLVSSFIILADEPKLLAYSIPRKGFNSKKLIFAFFFAVKAYRVLALSSLVV